MIQEFIAKKIRLQRIGNKIIYKSILGGSEIIEDGCQVGASGDDPENPYCISDGCSKKCILHKREIDDHTTEYWCTCE